MHNIDWCEGGFQLADIETKYEIYHGKAWQLMENTCT